MCFKAVDTFCHFVFDSVSIQYETKDMCGKAVSNDPFILKYSLRRYKTKEICNKAVDDFIRAYLHDALFTNVDIFFFDEDSGNVTLFSGEPETIIHVRVMV